MEHYIVFIDQDEKVTSFFFVRMHTISTFLTNIRWILVIAPKRFATGIPVFDTRRKNKDLIIVRFYVQQGLYFIVPRQFWLTECSCWLLTNKIPEAAFSLLFSRIISTNE